MKIEIAYVGKKLSDYDVKIEDYKKRLSKYANITDCRIDHGDKITESKKFLDKIKSDDYVLLLDETGSDIDSVEFAEFLDLRQNDSTRRIIIIIGGAYGVTSEIQNRANYVLRFSKMVWPHELARLMLYEQIYRAFSILEGTPYHHK